MIPALDRLTGRITMYRLVTVLLVVVAAAAVVLSLVGALPYTPAELLASLAIAVGSCVVSTRLAALLLRIRPHTESSVITGLLLFFLFWPSLDPRDLGGLALAGALATASKYLIAWRGRHLLNPAAAGATLVAFTGLNSAVWWVATGALLPLVLLGAVLVLYRTRRLGMGALFAVVAVTIITVRLIGGGQDAADALSRAITSYPVVFFAGFMLSEPLTLPPRRWQQFALAALVGVLFTIPYDLGGVFVSFEFALVLGNLLAFAVGQRRAVRLRLDERRQLTPTAWEFRFRPRHPVRFEPGQYLELTLPHQRADGRGSRRTFSIASAPEPDGQVAVAMRISEPMSSFKRAMLELRAGSEVTATSVGGDFLLPRDASVPVLLVAGGIGITPFLSHIGAERGRRDGRDVVLVYRVGSLDELAFVDELAGIRVVLVSPDAPTRMPDGWTWAGPEPITAATLSAAVPDLADRVPYVSGSPEFVNRLRRELRAAGARRVRTDYFTGY